MDASLRLSWEYIGDELAIFWISPYGHGKEKIASFWWPAHPVEATEEVEKSFEQIASSLIHTTELQQQVKALTEERDEPTLFIGTARRAMFTENDSPWNGWVRDITALLEVDERVDVIRLLKIVCEKAQTAT